MTWRPRKPVGRATRRSEESGMKKPDGRYIAIGVTVGVAIGAATHNLAVWIVIGVAIGVALSQARGGRD